MALALASAGALAGTTASLTGYVTGPDNSPLANVAITVTSPVLIGPRTATTDARGFFRLTQLPPGESYRARFEASGFSTTERSGIALHIDETIKLPTVRMAPQQTTVAIVVVEEKPVVDQSNPAVGSTMTNEFLDKVPAPRNTTAVLQLAPAAATDALGTTFRGASSPENNYVVDGLNTTGVLTGLDTSALPTEFIQEIQVKTGGYEPEYGRATGGQALVLTKSGGNEFHGDVFLYVTPFEGPRHTVVQGDTTGVAECSDAEIAAGSCIAADVGKAASIYRMRQNLLAQIGFDLGGYIIKDRLWFFAGYAPELRLRSFQHEFRLLGDEPAETRDNPALSPKAIEDRQRQLTHYYILNFTFNVNQNHSLRLSASGNPGNVTGVRNLNTVPFQGDPGVWLGSADGGAMDVSLTYNGKLADGLLNLDTTVGYHTEKNWQTPFQGKYQSAAGDSVFNGQEIDGAAAGYQYRIYYPVPEGCRAEDGSEQAPCGYNRYLGGGYGGIVRTKADRLVIKPVLSAFVNDLVGNHVIKLGGDLERNHVLNRRAFSGGPFVTAYSAGTDENGEQVYDYLENYFSMGGSSITWKGLDNDDSYFTADSITHNYSAFVQDSWNLLSNLSLNLGLRWERQQLQDLRGFTRIDIKDNIAPRLGVIFDVTGQGKSKLFANFGRYYESIPLDINDRALSTEGFTYYYYTNSEFPDYTPQAQPLTDDYLAASLGGTVSPIQANLKGQYSDQFLVGFEYELMKDLSAGITGIYANLGNVIEDISPDNGTTYLIANPGAEDIQFYEAELNEDGTPGEPVLNSTVFRRCIAATDPLTGAPTTYCFPKATRTYRALELTMNKRFSDGWTAQASYTLSQTFGNYPGLFAQSRGQLDPNITSQFDLANLLVNRNGYLDNDRRHLVKLAGAYQFDFGTSVGLTANIQSGTPILYLGAHPVYGAGEAFVLPRSAAPSDAPEGIEARTPWVYALDANVQHEFRFANARRLSVGLQLNNILNAQSALRVNQNYTLDVSNPANGASTLGQAQCYDLVGGVLSVPKNQCTANGNFGNPTAYQDPFSLRLEVKYSF